MKIDYTQILTDILTKEGALGNLKKKFKELAVKKPSEKTKKV